MQDCWDLPCTTVARPPEGAMSWLDDLLGERYQERVQPLPGIEDGGMSGQGVAGLDLAVLFVLFLLGMVIPTLT